MVTHGLPTRAANTVSVVDLVYTPGTTVTLEGFNQPWDVMTDYPGIQFVSNYGNGTVVAIHPQTKQVLRTFQVGQGPTEMAFDGGHIYVAEFRQQFGVDDQHRRRHRQRHDSGGRHPDGNRSQPQRHTGVCGQPGF